MLSRLINTIASTFYKTKWTHHLPVKHPNRPLQTPIAHWRIFRGDIVQMRVGDDRGKVGKVVKVFRKQNRVIVNGLNKNIRFKANQEGKMIKMKKSSAVHVSNVGLYDSAAKKPVRVTIGYHPDTGEVLRVSKKSGRIFYRNQALINKLKREKRGRKRKLGIKDTPGALAHKVTYKGEDFGAIRREFEEFIAQKEAREKLLVFKE